MKENVNTATDSTTSSGVGPGASEPSPEDEDDCGSKMQKPAVGPEIGVALAWDTLAGASGTTQQQPTSPTLSPPLMGHDQTGTTSAALDTTPRLGDASATLREKDNSHLTTPERPPRPVSVGGQTLVADEDEHVDAATKWDEYAPAFRLRLRNTTVSQPPCR